MNDGLQQLLREQARAYICGELGHARRFALPIQKRDERREVLTICATCREEAWVQLPQNGWAQFSNDLAEGRIR